MRNPVQQEGVDARIQTWAASRYGVITREELKALGCSPAAITRRVRSGALNKIRPTVFRIAAVGPSWAQELYAISRWLEPFVVVSHRAAAAIWKLGDPPPGILEVTTTRSRTRAPGVILHTTDHMPPRDRRVRGLIPVTDPTRTVIDCCGVLGDRAAESVIDDACHARLTTVERLTKRIDELSGNGRNGVGRARRLLEKRIREVERPESRLTRKLLNLIQASHLPNPDSLFPVTLPNGVTLHPDLSYPAFKIALEAESYKHHGDWLGQRRDMQRTNALQPLGWIVLRFTWEDVTQRPEYVIATIEDALRSRGALI